MNLSDAMVSRWYFFLLGVVGSISGVRAFLAWEKGRYWFDKRKLTLPFIKKPMRQLVTARFTRTLSTLLGSGIQLVNAMVSSAETVNNVVIEKALTSVTEEVKTGASLSGQLKKIEYFPGMMTSMISIGEEAGEMDEMLEKTAAYYDEESDAAITKLTSFIEPFAIVFVGILVSVIIIAMYLPLFQSYSAVS
jgi:type IV pilus assembly protein PilC